MRYILNSTQMATCDAHTMQEFGVPSAVLMERAAKSVVEEITERFPSPESRILIACGSGNNGGDGLAMARLLLLRGYPVTILFLGKEEKLSVEAAKQFATDETYGIAIVKEIPDEAFDVIVDAVFGIGLAREIGGNYRTAIEKLNEMSGFKVAVDISSGISADNGKVLGVAFKADLTATFGFAKIGQLLFPGAAFTGELIVEDIGIDENSLLDLVPDVRTVDEEELILLPKRIPDSNKGTYGHVLVVAGSYNMAGAAAFSAGAAYRSGAGLVRVVTEAENRTIIQSLIPEAILSTYDEKTDMDSFAADLCGWADAVVLGPGIGRSRQAEDLVHAVLTHAKVPCVVDADGLNILSVHPDWIRDTAAELVATPHPGEMSRLLNTGVEEIKEDLIGRAREFAAASGAIAVLKDARTVISTPDGKVWINLTGNNGMATAGSGDVLTGVIGAFLAQGLSPEMAAVLGVWVHGAAGDLAAGEIGQTSLMASDILNGLCGVFISTEKESER